MRMTTVLVGLGIGFSGALLMSQPSNAAGPLPSGTAVVVLLDTSGNLPEPYPGPPTDMLVFTGGRTFLTELPGCHEGQLPLRSAVLVDAGGPRSSRLVNVFVLGPDPIPPGTRVTGFVPGITCISGGIVYRKYTGTVE